MQINGLSGVQAYNPYTSNKSAVKMESISLPEFGWLKIGQRRFPTYTPTDRNDEEIKAAMIELAKQDARNGRHKLQGVVWNNQSAEYHALQGEFVQSVSPDRRSIVPAMVAQLEKATKLRGNVPLIDDSLTQLMLNGIKVGINNKPGFQPGLQYDAKNKMVKINYFGITAGDEVIGSYSTTYGWGATLTKAEKSREMEIHSLYYETWKAETAKMKAESNQ